MSDHSWFTVSKLTFCSLFMHPSVALTFQESILCYSLPLILVPYDSCIFLYFSVYPMHLNRCLTYEPLSTWPYGTSICLFYPHVQFSSPGWTQCLVPFKVLTTNTPSSLALGQFNEHLKYSPSPECEYLKTLDSCPQQLRLCITDYYLGRGGEKGERIPPNCYQTVNRIHNHRTAES